MGATAKAQTFDGMDAVEIKVTIKSDEELRAERAMRVNEDTADVRLIYFYDTPELDLFAAGIALRARLIKGDADDSTVKFRPVEPAQLSDEWRDQDGFKLEADWCGDRTLSSASLTRPQRRDEITEVEDGTRAIAKLFDQEQEHFLTAFSPRPVDFGTLCVMGPIRALRWKLKQKGFAHELTVEEWRLPDGDGLVEVSIKVAPGRAHAAREAFDRHLRDLNLSPEGAQETKTRTALEYFAGVCRRRG